MFAPVRNVRRAAVAVTLLSTACLALTACQGAAAAGTAASPVASQPPTVVYPTEQASETAAPAPTPTATRAGTGTGTGALPVDLVRCAPANLTAAPAQRVEPTNPDNTYAVDIQLTNSGGHTCQLQGFPTVGIAGQGDPTRNKPLKVTDSGAAHSVRLAPGHSAWLRLTFHQVLGEADGYCASGATPSTPPSIVLGVPSVGIQLGLSDGGNFAECDDVVRATSFLATHP